MFAWRFSWVLFVLFSVSLFGGCLCNPGDENGEDIGADGIICNPPYMLYADGCCLDRDGNGICDADELTTTTARMRQTTTTSAIRQATTSTVHALVEAASTTATTSTNLPTTTVAAVACNRHEDCGPERNYTRCHQGSVVMYFEKPRCEHPGKPDAMCTIKSSIQAYQKCESWEACVNAKCMNASDMSCDDACEDKGMASWYCDSGISCSGNNNVRAPLGDIWCQPKYCCCNATVQGAVTTSTLHPTTTTLGGCSDTGCRARCIAQYPKGNNPLEYAVDGVCETGGSRYAACPEWSYGFDRAGCFYQTCGNCCSGQSWGRQCDCICLGLLYSATTTTTTLNVQGGCVDQDGNMGNIYVQAGVPSSCTDGSGTYKDQCGGTINLEYTCINQQTGPKKCVYMSVDCPLVFGRGSVCVLDGGGRAYCSNAAAATTHTTTTTQRTTTTTIRHCTDSDGGRDYYTSGICWGYNQARTWYNVNDYCIDSRNLYECYCGDADLIYAAGSTCPSGCSQGRCNPTTTTTTLRHCIDSDGGISYYVAGSCQGYNSDYTQWKTDSDYCSGAIIYECYCGADNRLNHSLIICPDGCANNRCNQVG